MILPSNEQTEPDQSEALDKAVRDALDELAQTRERLGRHTDRDLALLETAIRLDGLGVQRDWARNALLDACDHNQLLADDGERRCNGTIDDAFLYDGTGDGTYIPNIRTLGVVSDDSTPVLADRLLTRSDLLNLPDPEPMIDNVLDQGTTALLYGKWGTIKTFIAIDWAASVATGRPWQARDTQQRRVLYVVGEGAFGFKGRVDAWESGWQHKIGDDQLSILPEPVNLINSSDVNNLRALIDWGGYDFVVLDTLARCMVGADENSAKDCGVVVDAMTRLLASTPGPGRGVVLGVHHAGKDGKTLRGSSAFESGADTVYFTSRDERVYSVTREKRKDGSEHDHHLLELDPIPGTNSCVIKAGSSWSHVGETNERTATLRLIMSQHFGLTGATSAQLRQLAVDDGPMTKATFYRALSDLLEQGWLINTGTDKRPFYTINALQD
jgi:hypothetical protein